MKNTYIFKDERYCYFLMDKNECIEMFGEDYLEEYGSEVPQELIEKYKKHMEEFRIIQNELRKFKT